MFQWYLHNFNNSSSMHMRDQEARALTDKDRINRINNISNKLWRCLTWKAVKKIYHGMQFSAQYIVCPFIPSSSELKVLTRTYVHVRPPNVNSLLYPAECRLIKSYYQACGASTYLYAYIPFLISNLTMTVSLQISNIVEKCAHYFERVTSFYNRNHIFSDANR